ncbi:hypothetical protein Tco_0194956 [Tanacetum coccineum]
MRTIMLSLLYFQLQMNLSACIQVADPTKVKVGERERAEGKQNFWIPPLSDEGGSANQGDSIAGGGQDAETELVTGVKIIDAENVIAERPRRPHKKRQAVTDASGSSYPPKKLMGDHISFSETATHESGAPTDSITGLNLCTIGPSKRFVISSDSSHHSSTNAAEAVIDSFIRFFHVPERAFNGISGEITLRSLHGFLFYSEYYHHLFTEFNVGTARQACLNVEVRMRTEYCLSKRKRLESECEKQANLQKARDAEVESLKAQLLLKETEAAKRNVALESEKNSVDGKVIELQSSISAKDLELKDLNVDEQIEEFQDAQISIVNDKVAKLDADLLEMALHLEENFYPHLLNTISGQRWLLTRNIKLVVVKCLNSQEYLTALGSAISRAIEKEIHDGLSASINHKKAGRGLEDVVAYNSAAEADYNSALQRLSEVDFPLLVELSAHKDVSTVDIMNLLCLESLLADAPGMSDLQPDIEQLTLPIHRPEDQVVLGAASTFDSMPAAIVSTTALSTTFASASSVPPITTDDYEIVNVDGSEDSQGNGQGNVASFPTVEFEKEELDTTPERDLPS